MAKEQKKQTIVQGQKKNFETLERAFDNHDAGLMECTLKSTGEKVAVLCAFSRDPETGITDATPFAMFFNGNPYDLLEPPELVKKVEVQG